MPIRCRSCGYLLLPEQERCPECGEDETPITVIAAGDARDLAWHRGWPHLVVTAVVAIVPLALAVSMIKGMGLRGLPCGLVFAFGTFAMGAGVVAEVRRRLMPSSVCVSPVAGSVTDVTTFIGFDGELLWEADGQAIPLVCIDDVTLQRTSRADRFQLEVAVRPLAAALPADQVDALCERHDDGEVIAADHPSSIMMLTADAAAAQTFADQLRVRVEDVWHERIDVDDELIRCFFDEDENGVWAVLDDEGAIALRVGPQGITAGRRTVAWSDVRELWLLEGPIPRKLPSAADESSWQWMVHVASRPWFDFGLRLERRALRPRVTHTDPRMGVALWSLLERVREEAGRSQ